MSLSQHRYVAILDQTSVLCCRARFGLDDSAGTKPCFFECNGTSQEVCRRYRSFRRCPAFVTAGNRSECGSAPFDARSLLRVAIRRATHNLFYGEGWVRPCPPSPPGLDFDRIVRSADVALPPASAYQRCVSATNVQGTSSSQGIFAAARV